MIRLDYVGLLLIGLGCFFMETHPQVEGVFAGFAVAVCGVRLLIESRPSGRGSTMDEEG